jgi:alpha-ketoglutarate-dependent taurine dioxygenase
MPFFQIKVSMQSGPREELAAPGLELAPLDAEVTSTKHDLTLFLSDDPQGLGGVLEYDSALFEPETVRRLHSTYQQILAEVVRDPDQRVSALGAGLRPDQGHARADRARQSLERLRKLGARSAPAPAEIVRTGRLEGASALPLVVQPTTDDIDPIAWLAANRARVAGWLDREGAVLLRRFPRQLVERFEQTARVICDRVSEDGGEHERSSLSGRVYSPVFYPPPKRLLWHNENSFNASFPTKILFGCLKAAEQGGETTLVDSRQVYLKLDPTIRERFAAKKIMYVRNYRSGVGRSWQQVFKTQSRAEVEARCQKASMAYAWRGEDHLRTWCVRDAVLPHPRTGQMSWFNQAQHWHLACLEEEVRAALLKVCDPETLPRTCCYGDGAPIEDAVMEEICGIYQALEVPVRWEAGDVLIVDNINAAHGRNPFSGARELVVAMGDEASFDPPR